MLSAFSFKRLAPRAPTPKRFEKPGPPEIFTPQMASSEVSFAPEDGYDNAQDVVSGTRAPLAVHDILLLSPLAASASLARKAVEGMDPRIATSMEELCAHLEAERFKLVVVECAEGEAEMVRIALEAHRQLPSDDLTALIAFTPNSDGSLDVLRYTPCATAFAFLTAPEHQLRTHILKLIID